MQIIAYKYDGNASKMYIGAYYYYRLLYAEYLSVGAEVCFRVARAREDLNN